MRRLSFLICVTGLLFICVGLVAQTTSIKPVSFVGTTKFKPGKASSGPVKEIVEGPEVDETFDIPGISGNNSPARLPSNFVPRPAGNPIGSRSRFAPVRIDAVDAVVSITMVLRGQMRPGQVRRRRRDARIFAPIRSTQHREAIHRARPSYLFAHPIHRPENLKR